MKIQIFSDLHLEFADYSAQIDQSADVVVFAGDLFTRNRSVPWLEALHSSLPGGPEFIYVLGNHEGYTGYLPYTYQQLKSAIRNKHIHLLENERLITGGVKFVGSTLWTDYQLNGECKRDMAMAGAMMNDYRQIRMNRKGFSRMTPADAVELHQEAVSYIVSELEAKEPYPVVVISHHAPSPESLVSGVVPETVSAAYASDLTELMHSTDTRRAPALWIHGHIHSSCDYRIKQTRVVSNPRGYANYGYGNNPDFKDVLIVEV